MQELLFLTTRDYTIVTANRAAGSLFGLDSRKLRGRSLPGLFGLPEGEPIPGEVGVQEGPGDGRALQMLQSDVSSPAGEPIGLLFLARDVSEDRRREATLRRTLAENEVVLHELHHRVHNTLQTVTSLLRLKADLGGPPEAVQTLTESAEMVQRIAEIHRWAYDTREPDRLPFDEFVEQLCSDIYQQQRAHGGARLRLDTEPVRLDVRTAIPLLLLTGELLPKAFAKARKDSVGGEVHVEVSADSGVNWELRVTHSTGPVSDSDCCATRTAEIVAALAEQAGAGLRIDRTPTTTVSIVSPQP
jgi:two-component sensor histidine kinase